VRFKVRLLVRVPLTRGVTLREIRERSSDASLWGWVFRNSGNEIPAADAEFVLGRLEETEPKLGVDEDEPTLEDDEEHVERKDRPHVCIQAKLLKLGREMGLETWVARNDRGATYGDTRLGDLATVDQLPVGLPDAVRRTIELIDVIWLRRNEYVAAFEIEKSTLIYTGLLRMADLVTLLPNLIVPLFIVAPEERRGAVFEAMTRPTFSMGLQKPLEDACRYISFEGLEADLERHGSRVGLFDPRRYLDELAESVPDAE
jgi:hypothetical protein